MRRRTTPIASLLICLGAGLAPAHAAAHGGVDHLTAQAATTAGAVTGPVKERRLIGTLGKHAQRTTSGLFRLKIESPGTPDSYVLTHGPDTPNAVAAAAGGTGFSSASPQRQPVCAADRYQHFLYARTPGRADRLDEERSYLRSVIKRMDAVLNRESLASGGGNADFKVLCDGSGQPRIDRVISPSLDFTSVVTAAKEAGFADLRADYTIFFDTSDESRCGVGSFYPDETPGIVNRNIAVTGYGVTYRRCWGTSAPMHENAHNEGAVQPGAPHSTGSGDHCWQESDIECYAPDGGDTHQWAVTACGDYEHYDCNHDDYFDTAPEAGEWLATHLNIGSSANPFIARGFARPESYSTNRLWRGLTLNPEVSATTGRLHTYRMIVPRGARNLKIAMSTRGCAPSCQFKLDLYLRRGSKPTPSSYTCARRSDTTSKVCLIRRPKSGIWYAGVHSKRGPAGAPYKIKSTWRR